jgi:dTDP-4-amino-4,6-dideoxygalactose transaminase
VTTAAREVPVYKLEFEPEFVERFASGCAEILRSDLLAEGARVAEFEERFAAFAGSAHAVAVGSGTDALEVALRAVGVEDRDVIIPTNTFIATAVAARRAGGRVVLADIEDQTFALSPRALAERITPDTGAVVLVHVGGVIAGHAAEIAAICGRAGVPLIEDAAHAHGSSRGGLRAGTIGAAGAFSFFPTKVMTTGEGGMVTTNDAALAAKMRSLKNFGRDPSNALLCRLEGSNCKMTEFQALLGLLELERLPGRIGKRSALARRYRSRLDGTSYEVVACDGATSSHYKQILRTPLPTDALHAFCRERGVGLTGRVYRYPVHAQPVYAGLWDGEAFPVADAFARGHVCPPLYPELEADDVDFVCDVLKLAETELS